MYICLAKRVTPGQLKRKFSTFREENSRPQRGHKEKQPHKHKRLFSLFLAGVERFVRSKRRNSVLLDKSVYMFGKTRHSRTVEKNFSTIREENSRPQRGHKEKQPHKHMRLFSLFLAGVERFELPDDGVRVRSLTAWRHPNLFVNVSFFTFFNSVYFTRLCLFLQAF